VEPARLFLERHPSRRLHGRGLMPRQLCRRSALIAAVLLLANGAAVAPLAAQEAEPAKSLTPGKGSDLTNARCGICHDVTHITRAKLSRGEWQDNVRNMIERGAPIEPGEIPAIIDYLATYYNRDSEPPPADTAATTTGGDPVQRLLANNACNGCHALTQKIVGPSFREIAARYASDGGARARLAAKIKAGGAGNWGAIPMPPHAQFTDADLAQLAVWILAQK
jgi:cytochrome c551/c552